MFEAVSQYSVNDTYCSHYLWEKNCRVSPKYVTNLKLHNVQHSLSFVARTISRGGSLHLVFLLFSRDDCYCVMTFDIMFRRVVTMMDLAFPTISPLIKSTHLGSPLGKYPQSTV